MDSFVFGKEASSSKTETILVLPGFVVEVDSPVERTVAGRVEGLGPFERDASDIGQRRLVAHSQCATIIFAEFVESVVDE